jgi:protein-S-isoprenylcysteine O-methyltransferase Ste14
VPLSPTALIDIMWLAVLAIWLGAALITKRTVRKQPVRARLIHSCILFTAWLLLFERHLWDWAPPLRWQLLAESPATEWTAFVLTLTGLGFAIWARFYIGQNWSGTVTVKENHELMRGGPYAIVRHPIYSGLLLALLGTALAAGEVRGLVAAAIASIEFKRKSMLEERYMVDAFGQQYEAYRQRVKGLIPWMW